MNKIVYILVLLLAVTIGCKREDIAPIVPVEPNPDTIPTPNPDTLLAPYKEPIIEFGKSLEYVKGLETRTFLTLETFDYQGMKIDIALYQGESDSVVGVAYVFPSILKLQASAIMLNGYKVAKKSITAFLDYKYKKVDDLYLSGVYVKQWKSLNDKYYVLCLDGSFTESGEIEVGNITTVVYVNSIFYDLIISQIGS